MSQKDKTPVKSFAAVLSVLFVMAISHPGYAATDTRMQTKILENIKPVGQVHTGAVTDAAATPAVAAGPRPGKDVYTSTCMACHGTGVAGAPKVGDKAAWSSRAAKGIDSLLANAIKGLNAMPPKGTCGACSDEELKGAIQYMLKETGL